MKYNSRKKVCVFSHFFTQNYIPLYVRIYLDEIKIHFDKIILITNERNIEDLTFIIDSKISIHFVENEGYDFGMFYKAFKELDIDEYEQIACLNDSNIIFGKLKSLFEWGNNQSVDFWGLVDSYQKPTYSTHNSNYHIQSHFIVFNRAAVELLPEFFKNINFSELIKEEDIRMLKKKVINDWEIGISQYLLQNKLTCKSYVDSHQYSIKYKKGKPVNIPTKLYAQTIEDGIPIIKKRVVTSTELRHILTRKANWKRLINLYGDKEWDNKKLIEELADIRKEHIKNKFSKFLKIESIRKAIFRTNFYSSV